MFDKKFTIVFFLGVTIILVLLFGQDLLKKVSSMDDISSITESKSLKYYKLSCKYEDSEVCNKLGDIYKKEKEYEKAALYYERACELRNGSGCNNLAYMFNDGDQKNDRLALKLYKQGCKYKEMEACYNVGLMYFNAEGTRKNYVKAKYYFESSCEESIGAACNNLGYMYESGIYFSRNIQKAVVLYIKGCDDYKDATSCNNAGHIYEDIRGNTVSARQYYNKACVLENNYGCNKLENVLGHKIYEIENQEALEEAKQACNRSTVGGTMCHRVGLYYEKKEEVKKARKFFEMACEREQSQSCKHLGDLHR